MCKIYNSIGSLTTVKSHLHRHRIFDFKSLNEVISFQSYSIYRQQIVSSHEQTILQEENDLSIAISTFDSALKEEKINITSALLDEIDWFKKRMSNLQKSTQKNIIKKIVSIIKVLIYKYKIRFLEYKLDSKINLALSKLAIIQTLQYNRHQYIASHFLDAVNESCRIPLMELDRKKWLIDQVNTSILGALGEQKVEHELKSLSDEYFLINDFTLTLRSPIYFPQEKSYIKSIQIDHILVAPSGIFLIETKNWSTESMNNLSLYSPVQQIRRSSFVTFKLINEAIENNMLQLNRHHWGNRKIPIKNLIALTNSKPNEEFDFVKILLVKELVGYINYFKPIFSNSETQRMSEYLVDLNIHH